MSFTVGQPQPKGLDLLYSGLAQQAGQGIGGALEHFYKQKQENKNIEQMAPAIQELFKGVGADLSQDSVRALLKGGGNLQTLSPYYQAFGKQQEALAQKESQKALAERKEQQKIEHEERGELKKEKAKYQDIQDTVDRAESHINSLRELKPYVGTTYLPFTKSAGGHFRRSKAAQQRKKINTLKIGLEGLFREMATKGQLPQSIYQDLLSRLPSAEDTEKEYEGSLQGIEEILKGIEVPVKKFQERGSSSLPKGEKVKMRAPNGDIVPMDQNLVDEAIERGWQIS